MKFDPSSGKFDEMGMITEAEQIKGTLVGQRQAMVKMVELMPVDLRPKLAACMDPMIASINTTMAALDETVRRIRAFMREEEL